jgi:hypothetical protein
MGHADPRQIGMDHPSRAADDAERAREVADAAFATDEVNCL